MSAAMLLAALLPATIITGFAATIIAMLFLITRHIFLVVPTVPNEIDPFTASVVFAAMLAPVFGVPGRHMQIHRLTTDRDTMNHHRFAVDQLRSRIIIDVDLSVKAGLADADRYADIGSDSRRGDNSEQARN